MQLKLVQFLAVSIYQVTKNTYVALNVSHGLATSLNVH